jgi:serine/threonine-protein kinase
MDPDIEALVRAERLLEAARLLSERGDAHGASVLFERACDWASAAREALRACELRRAMELAAESGDAALCESAVTALEGDPKEALATASRLSGRGRDRWSARLLEIGGDTAAAAQAWERAGEPRRAAVLLERSGDPGAAGRVLEAAIRREPTAWPTVVALGALLARFGKHEAAVRTLQRVPEGAPERRDALAHLVPALERLGLSRAVDEASTELTALGGEATPEPVAADAPPTRPRLFGRYDVVREAASSPSARVLECVDVVRGERVAVKIFAAWEARGAGRDALARFEREVRAMRALDHPNVVPLREFVPAGPAIVLAWMAGGTLERLLSTTGSLAPARAVEIAASVLAALAEAHRVGIVHRDVKPSNILFEEAGGARLSDFGVAHLGDASTTATAGVFGTLAYMSPEQREGRPASPRSDLFSIGVVLREMLTGRRPSMNEAQLAAPSASHADLDARHDAIVDRLTAREAGARPDDAFEARAALLALPWPTRVDPHAAGARSERRSSAWPRAARLEVDVTGVAVDTWTGRRIERMPLTDATLARARSFACAGHPALQAVLRVDRDDGTLWLEATQEHPPSTRLRAAHRATLTAALEALHATGGVHGQIDADHVVVEGDTVVLRFHPGADPTATADRDWLALARL